MHFAPNYYRTALHNENIPDGQLTDRQRAIADAVRLCNSVADFTAIPTRTVTQIEVATIYYGTPDESVVRNVRHGIAKARAELDRMERALSVYGAQAFAPQAEPVDARGIDADTRHGIVTAMLRRISATGRVLVRAGTRRVTLDASRSYVVEPA